jgi:beta-glucanase (GH16 family)|tara:strand:- start:19017 stop:20246 length:1230 start_codon:yes stop_codon:yes gene_type:complete
MKQTIVLLIALVIVSCQEKNTNNNSATEMPSAIILHASEFTEASEPLVTSHHEIEFSSAGWLSFEMNIQTAGRYQVKVYGTSKVNTKTYIEDYIDNKDNRNYDITGKMPLSETPFTTVDGTPLNKGVHRIKLHVDGPATIEKITFNLMVPHQSTELTYEQSMTGSQWSLVWSDEFDGTMIDTTKWNYDVGNWGWGNNELEYYTVGERKNARIENGHLIIEALKDKTGDTWTSARLTTRGNSSFLYGKIEVKGKVPSAKGTWAAGWMLADSYIDELSWPYCGEIDIMESVGFEIDSTNGNGLAHLTAHTATYYHKLNNQISSAPEVKNMSGEFHLYAIEWSPKEIKGFVDGIQYYTYDKTADELEWPFTKPQNILLNLAMGGDWGGSRGMDTVITSQQLLIDYVRVYALK